MKRLALTLVAGAFGTLMMLPVAHAGGIQDMNNDAGTIQSDRHLHQEEEKTVEDYVNGVGIRSKQEQADPPETQHECTERGCRLDYDSEASGYPAAHRRPASQ